MEQPQTSFDAKFEEDPYPRKVPGTGARTDAEIAQEQAVWLNELGEQARTRTLKYLADADKLDAHPDLQEKKVNMACKLGSLLAKMIATSGSLNKARRSY